MPARVAVVTDVHGNLPALIAALAEIDAAGCDAIICLGDVIGIGPFPAETLALLLARHDVRFVMGNHDAWFAHGLPASAPDWMSPGEVAHHHWVHAQLDPALRAVVADWPYRRREAIGMAAVTCLHYALDDTGRGFRPIVDAPSPDQLDTLFADADASLVLYGHHHPAADAHGAARYVNPGALGCSFDGLARYLVIESGDDGDIRIHKRSAAYDRAALFLAFEERAVPERELILRAFYGC